MKSEKLKRNFWLSAEIECMLNLIKEFKAEQSCAPSSTTQTTFTQIARKMKKRGLPNKSPTQIRRKWFQMKSAYLCFKKGNVERLFLIPERFRSAIAQLVDNMDKVPPGLSGPSTLGGPMHKPQSTLSAPITKAPSTLATPIQKKPPKLAAPIHKVPSTLAAPYHKTKASTPKKTTAKHCTSLDKFMAKIEQNNSLLNYEYKKLQESLFQYEKNCQTARDYNILKYLSI